MKCYSKHRFYSCLLSRCESVYSIKHSGSSTQEALGLINVQSWILCVSMHQLLACNALSHLCDLRECVCSADESSGQWFISALSTCVRPRLNVSSSVLCPLKPTAVVTVQESGCTNILCHWSPAERKSLNWNLFNSCLADVDPSRCLLVCQSFGPCCPPE